MAGNTHRFVAGVDRMAERNHLVGTVVPERLPARLEDDDPLEGEDLLPQGDYDVHVSDARRLGPPRVGEARDAAPYATEAVA